MRLPSNANFFILALDSPAKVCYNSFRRVTNGGTTREHSSAGRALALQARGHRFEPCCSHHAKLCRTLSGIKASHIGCVKSNLWGCSSGGRAPALQAGCREFEPLHLHQYGTIKLGRKGTAFTARQCLHWKLVMRWFGGTPSPERTSKVKTES